MTLFIFILKLLGGIHQSGGDNRLDFFFFNPLGKLKIAARSRREEHPSPARPHPSGCGDRTAPPGTARIPLPPRLGIK